MCYGTLKQCQQDAKKAIAVNEKYAKAYFWAVKSLVRISTCTVY